MQLLPVGIKDSQTVVTGGRRAAPLRIAGVQVHDLGNILTRSGWMVELFRTDWPVIGIAPQQVIWAQLNPSGITDWHRHGKGTDHLIGVGGNIKLGLFDGREDSPTRGATEMIRLGGMRPVMVVVPPGVWHALRNESGEAAGYINVTDQLYDHHDPDNWRLPPGTPDIPAVL